MKYRVPIELIAVSIGSLVSYFMKFHENYGVKIIGDIPTGLPAPMLPAFEIIPHLALYSFVIALITYTITIFLETIIAEKERYSIHSNQELLAMGSSNLLGSFFFCLPITGSVSRTFVQHSAGGVSQLASVVSCFFVLIVMLLVAPAFGPLPMCVLASIIVVAQTYPILNCRVFYSYLKVSKWDAFVWGATFFPTYVVNIGVGFMCGILASIISVLVERHRFYICLLGVVPKTDLFLDVRRYKGVEEINRIKIVQFSGMLNFAVIDCFTTSLYETIGLNPSSIIITLVDKHDNVSITDSTYLDLIPDLSVSCIIFDFGCLIYLDHAGVEIMRRVVREFYELHIAVFIASCSVPVLETFERCDKYENKNGNFIFFPTVQDSVSYAQTNVLKNKDS